MQEEGKNKYIDILQIFRGIAALMVVVHHAVGSLKYYHKVDGTFINYIGKFGKLGVDFFFVLSGFIISYAAYYKYNKPEAFKNYLKNRIIRVYVPYLPIGILMYLLYTSLPGFSNADREISLLTTLTLFPNGNPALSVAWTLTFELCFYLFFSISFYSKKAWNYFVIVWTILIVIFNYSPLNHLSFLQHPIFRVFFSTYNIEFIIGYLLSLMIIHKIKINFKLTLLGIVVFLILFVYTMFFSIKSQTFYVNYIFAGLLFMVLYVAIGNFNKKINSTILLMTVGNASYSIYLVHNPLQMIILRFCPKINSVTSVIISLVLVLFLSSLIGYLYYLIFEKKCLEFIKTKIARR